MKTINIDGEKYTISSINDKIESQLDNLKFVDEQILQKNNEMQIAETAKIGYTRALKREIEKMKVDGKN